MNPLDTLCINTIRTLTADMVQRANSGHPGMPMGMAPVAHVLFSKHLRFSPNTKWVSLRLCSHSSLAKQRSLDFE